jgi:hypothetical protein
MAEEQKLRLSKYSEKSFAVYGDSRPYSSGLKSLGGRFNSKLMGGPGWIYSNNSFEKVQDFVRRVNDGTQPPTNEVEPRKQIIIPLNYDHTPPVIKHTPPSLQVGQTITIDESTFTVESIETATCAVILKGPDNQFVKAVPYGKMWLVLFNPPRIYPANIAFSI